MRCEMCELSSHSNSGTIRLLEIYYGYKSRGVTPGLGPGCARFDAWVPDKGEVGSNPTHPTIGATTDSGSDRS